MDEYDSGWVSAPLAIPSRTKPEHKEYPADWTEAAAKDGADLKGILREHDEAKIKKCSLDIDTLLVFAGLFSAVLTTFVIESYKMLKQDPADVANLLLLQISQQLYNSSVNMPPLFQTPPQLPSFHSTTSALRVNTLWFSSLICSLIAASLSMLIKQWLQEYLAWGCTAPEECIRIRHVRYEGLLRWRVFEMAGFLPILLQISLLLFFLGLSDFLRSLHPTVGWVTTGLMISWLSLLAIFVCAPMVSATCPYKVAILTPVSLKSQAAFFRVIYNLLRSDSETYFEFWGLNSYHRFPGDELGVRRDATLDVPAIIGADKALMDNNILTRNLHSCMKRLTGQDAVLSVRAALAHRLGDRPVTSLRELDHSDYARIPTEALVCLSNILVDALERDFPNLREDGEVDKSFWRVEAVAWLSSVAQHAELERRTLASIPSSSTLIVYKLLCSAGTDLRREILRIVLTNFPIMTNWEACYPQWRSLNHASVGKKIISDALHILPNENIHPLRACREIFALLDALSSENTSILEKWTTGMKDLEKELIKGIKGSKPTSNNHFPMPQLPDYWDRPTHIQSILRLGRNLNEKKRGFLGKELGQVLSKIGTYQDAWMGDEQSKQSPDAVALPTDSLNHFDTAIAELVSESAPLSAQPPPSPPISVHTSLQAMESPSSAPLLGQQLPSPVTPISHPFHSPQDGLMPDPQSSSGGQVVEGNHLSLRPLKDRSEAIDILTNNQAFLSEIPQHSMDSTADESPTLSPSHDIYTSNVSRS